MKTTDPYQWFFPLGFLLGIGGVGIWIPYALHWTVLYPGLIHADLMIGGFFLTVAAGFLMTAVPRFTGTDSATTVKKVVVLLPVCGLCASSFFASRPWFHAWFVITVLLVLRFGYSRLRKSRLAPMPPMLLAATGLLSGFVGSIFLYLSDVVTSQLWMEPLGRRLFLYGMPTGLILGIGSQLIPAILGLTMRPIAPMRVTGSAIQAQVASPLMWRFGIYAIIFALSFVLDGLGYKQSGALLLSLLATFILSAHWRLYKKPRLPGFMVWSLLTSGWFFLIGLWVPALTPTYAVHGAHVFFIGGISLMIFSIGTRVTLAHGGHDQKMEIRSKALLAMFILMLLAVLARLSAPFGGNYYYHLAYASACWIAAVICWATVFLPKVFKRNSLSLPKG